MEKKHKVSNRSPETHHELSMAYLEQGKYTPKAQIDEPKAVVTYLSWTQKIGQLWSWPTSNDQTLFELCKYSLDYLCNFPNLKL